MSWDQKQFTLSTRSKGLHIVTDEVEKNVPEIKAYKKGLLNLFIQHTSAALTLNENWDKDTRLDLSDSLDRMVPEKAPYRHSAEGPDDMPAHVKSSLLGASLTVPITNGKLNMGTWQDIQLAEFRASPHSRKIVATIQGQK